MTGPPSRGSSNPITKVLGVIWNTEIEFDFSDICTQAKELPVTRRLLLRMTARIFDPLGLLSPFTIFLKVLFQDLCVDHAS